MFARYAAIAMAAAANIVLAGCDSVLVPPAPATTGLSISYSMAGGPTTAAFDAADNAVVTVAVSGLAPVERSFQFTPGQSEIRLRVELEVSTAQAVAAVTLKLRKGTDVLFSGSQTVTVKQGEVTQSQLALAPVAAGLALPTTFNVNVLGQAVQLPGAVVFATGDTITGGVITYSTSAPELQLTPGGRVIASQNGTYTVLATSGALTGTVQLQVSSTAASVSFVAGAGPAVYPGEPVLTAPAVKVADANGFALRNVPVTFTADSGGVVGQAVVTTNNLGIATLPTWTLGRMGPNTLTATVAGIAPARLTLNTLDPCTRRFPAAVNTTVNGTLLPGIDCLAASGRLNDFYTLTLSAPSVLVAEHTSAQYAPALFTYFNGTTRQLSARSTAAPGTVAIEHVLPAGDYSVQAAAPVASTGGSYTLALRTIGESQNGCRADAAIAMFGSIAQGRIAPEDCLDTAAPDAATVTRRYDGYGVLLQAGETVTVTATADFPWLFSRWTGNTLQQVITSIPAGQSRSFSVTAATNSFHYFYVLNSQSQGGGSYRMTFSGAVSQVNVAPAAKTLVPGETQQYSATAIDAFGNTVPASNAIFTSSNPLIARVDSLTGVVTAVTGGNATITARFGGMTGSAPSTVCGTAPQYTGSVFSLWAAAGVFDPAAPPDAATFNGTTVLFAGGLQFGTNATDFVVGYNTVTGASDLDRNIGVCRMSIAGGDYTRARLRITKAGPVPAGSVLQETFTTGGGFVLVRYTFTNTSAAQVNGLRVGLGLDWDLNFDNSAGSDRTRFNSIIGATEAFETAGQFAGVAGVGTPIVSYSGGTNGGASAEPTTPAAIYARIGGGIETTTIGPADIRQWVGFGDFNIPAGQSLKVTMVFAAGNTAQQYSDNVASARATTFPTVVF